MCKASHWPHYLSTLLFYSPTTPVWVNHPHILSVFQLPSLVGFITASLLSPSLFPNLNFSPSRSVFALSVLFLLTFACFSRFKVQGRLYKVLSFPGTRREFDSQTPDEEFIMFLYCCLDSVEFCSLAQSRTRLIQSQILSLIIFIMSRPSQKNVLTSQQLFVIWGQAWKLMHMLLLLSIHIIQP